MYTKIYVPRDLAVTSMWSRCIHVLLVGMQIINSITFMKRNLAICTRNILKFCISFDPEILPTYGNSSLTVIMNMPEDVATRMFTHSFNRRWW